MTFLACYRSAGSALLAERDARGIVASNLANAETTRTIEGGPYTRQNVVFAARHPISTGFAATLASFTDLHTQGVQVVGVFPGPLRPGATLLSRSPGRGRDRLRSFPNVNPVEESVNLVEAARSYQLNISAIQTTKAMIQSAISIAQ